MSTDSDKAAYVPGPELAATVHRMQANGHLRCVNCGETVGERHGLLCYAYAQARSHLEHMTDGRFHDHCWACKQRRRHGGCGLEPVSLDV